MNITFTKRAVKDLSRLDAKTKQRIKKGIESIPLGDIKILRGHDELYRLRIGGWRIVFSYPNSSTVLIERVAPRGNVYREVR